MTTPETKLPRSSPLSAEQAHLQRLVAKVRTMSEEELASLRESLTPKLSTRIPAEFRIPSPKQAAFLALTNTREVLYGGAAGGGKTIALLISATRYVDDYPVHSVLIRRRFRDHTQSGGLLQVANEWFRGTDAAWDHKATTWRFPSGASIAFGYLEHEGDELRYQGGGYHMVGFDELTQIRENQYIYLFSRTRRLKDSPIPIRVRSATNPGGPGHEWVRNRWNLPYGPRDDASIKFIEAKVQDNPFLDVDDYMESLKILDTGGSGVTYLQLAKGDWSAMGSGGYFHPENFKLADIEDLPPRLFFRNIIRYWDFGTSEKTELNADPDYTVGMKIGITNTTRPHVIPGERGKPDVIAHLPDYYIFDVRRDRLSPGGVADLIRETARNDGIEIPVWLERERGAAGKHLVHYYRTHVLNGYSVNGMYVQGDKLTRGKMAAGYVDEGRVFLVDDSGMHHDDRWIADFTFECGAFGLDGTHDDQVDTFSYGIMALEKQHLVAGAGGVRKVQPTAAGMSRYQRA